jgi:predicted RNA-binding protein with PUA-like domain
LAVVRTLSWAHPVDATREAATVNGLENYNKPKRNSTSLLYVKPKSTDPMAKKTAAPASNAVDASALRYWLVKSEPDVFSIDDLAKAKNATTYWDGVRNYQARNTLRDLMKVGDQVLFYHSNASPPAIAGLAKVVKEGYPDHTAWDPKSDHYDPKSTKENPIWYMIDIQWVRTFSRPLPLPELKEVAALKEMVLVQKGSRLSVQPVRPNEFEWIITYAK